VRARFFISIRATAPPEVEVRLSVDCCPVATGENKQVVLVVDDEPAIRLLCRVNLEIGGYEVREAGSIEEARAQMDGVDVVLLDMHIGNERGDVLLKELAEQAIPVAVVTGSTDLESISGTSAAAVLGKPFTIDELEATVARLAVLRASRR
jgi:DNA-binding NtrC family response regulator